MAAMAKIPTAGSNITSTRSSSSPTRATRRSCTWAAWRRWALTRQHDIRFVEDNWESPALGAWGLGWEVWLDGQEITQFTYFQQAGGIELDPVAVEITYGLERIVMYLQGVKAFTKITGRDITYGDVLLRGESRELQVQL